MLEYKNVLPYAHRHSKCDGCALINDVKVSTTNTIRNKKEAQTITKDGKRLKLHYCILPLLTLAFCIKFTSATFFLLSLEALSPNALRRLGYFPSQGPINPCGFTHCYAMSVTS